ncbi:hypothetical protein [Enterococcus sp. BWR-S5]|uniref:hypothetical protein n=1 Tax=Enterococcus sp. BWR-S5 TaxID=2787714 RepID=UPI001921E4C7|nr:hypothetical protein [Enterococcus sp. BWR-S5]MBL1223740.1 hypothetical protein [Enterococcus sp. BWR-S5]
MTIKGYQFDRAKVTALKDASLYSALHLNQSTVITDRGNEMAVSVNGLDATIDTGQAVICGRLVEITAAETVSIPANTSGFLVITIDLSELNESEGTPGSSDYVFTNNQLRCEFVEALNQQDLNDGGVLYTFNLGAVSTNSSSITYTKNTDAWSYLNYQDFVPQTCVVTLTQVDSTGTNRSLTVRLIRHQKIVVASLFRQALLNQWIRTGENMALTVSASWNGKTAPVIPEAFRPTVQANMLVTRNAGVNYVLSNKFLSFNDNGTVTYTAGDRGSASAALVCAGSTSWVTTSDISTI